MNNQYNHRGCQLQEMDVELHQDNIDNIDNIDNVEDLVNEENPIDAFRSKTRELEEREEHLKISNAQRDTHNKALYDLLYKARADLMQLQHQEYNADHACSDLGVYMEFEDLRSLIKSQNKKIETLREEIQKQGLASSTNSKEYIDIKEKIAQLEKEIEFSRKFTSTQYFRHYLELPSMFKVCFEEVKLEFQRKTKVKEQLEAEKLKYEERKKEIARQIQEKRELYHALMKELYPYS